MMKFDSIEPPQARIAPMYAPGLNGYDTVNNGNKKPANDRWREVPDYKRPQTRV